MKLAEEQNKNINSTDVIPIMPLRNTVVFPHQVIKRTGRRNKNYWPGSPAGLSHRKSKRQGSL